MTYIRIRFKKRGGHYHCRLFTAQNYAGTFSNCGGLTFDEREFADVKGNLNRCEWIDDDRAAPLEPGKLGEKIPPNYFDGLG